MTTVIFIQEHGRSGIIEATLKEAATIGDLHDALVAAGLAVDGESFIFIDEAEEHIHGDRYPTSSGVPASTSAAANVSMLLCTS